MNLKNFPKRLDSKTSSLRIAVPENLDLALEGLIRKVLREQPKTDDIYSFAADYFETLLKIRDKAGAKFTTGQLCPFHNDEDAHEMIKLAGTFAKPKLKTDDGGKMRKPSKKKETDAKTNKRTKPTGSVKDKQPVKQVTPDLIKKLPTVTKPEVEKKTSDSQGRDSEEATPEKEEEFLTSDPIKELVEKEMMMEAGKNKTDGNDKTGNENAQGEKPDVMVGGKEKNQENEEVETKKVEDAENEKTQTEVTTVSEDTEEGEKEFEDVKADTKNSTKEEDVREGVMKPETTGETQKEEGDVIKEAEKLSETVPEVPKTGEVHRNEKKEVNKKMETFPVSESGKKVMDVLPSEKLPEITEDVTEKNPDATQTESEQPNNSQTPTDQPFAKPVQETLASIPEHIPLELSPDGATQPETDNASNEAKENQKPEATPITDQNARPTGDEQTQVENQEKEAEKPEKHPEEENQDEQSVETTAEEPKPEDSFTVSEDKTFGEIIKNTEEEETTAGSEEIKPNEAEKISTKPQESTTTVDDSEPPIEKVDETTTEEHLKPTTDDSDKPVDANDSTQVDEKTLEISEEVKNDTTNTDESDNQETQTDDISGAQQAQPETKPEERTPNVDKEATETTTEAPGDELCSVVDNKQAPTDKMSVEKTEEEPEPDKPAAEGTQKLEKEQEMIETKQTEELCTVVDVPKEPETAQNSEDKLENMQTEQEELCRVVDNPKLDTTDEKKIQETQDEEIKPEVNEKTNDTPAEEHTDGEKPAGGKQTNIAEPTTPQTDTQHVIRVEEVEIPTKPDEIQIKTIQTHYYDTLQVPETVTREYRMHNLPTAGLLKAANFLPPNGLDENMNSTPENLNISPPGEENVPTPPEHTQNTPAPVLPLDLQTHKTDSDDLLDLMTPTSGYSMNLSEISLLTVSELFLDSEKRYSSLEKEETHVTPKPETANGRQEVEEVIEKTILPSHVTAVPVPPRDGEELNEEANVQTTGNMKEEKKGEDKPENDSTEGSSNGRSVDSDIPFISVEVKTVIETQILDDEEEKIGERPEVEVKVRATIDIQDDVDVLQPAPPNRIPVEVGTVTSSKESQEKPEERPGVEEESKDQDEEKQGVCSGGVEGSSSLDSDITGSSAATEIKRTDSSKRNLSSVRSLVSAQSLDLEKRNPLLKTRSLSNFRHGVTDFEVWNKIEKELEDAAIKIQSKFRGYKTRKKLQRGNAVQITTEELSVSTTPVEAEAKDEEGQQQQQSTGEFHDSIVLSEHPR